jgi:hypothetical protein
VSIGIAGLGGVGGIVAEYLARLGLGQLVLVDYDRLERENFNRSQGATRTEAARRIPKVKVYSRVAKASATAPRFKVVARRTSAAEEDGIRHLLDCDLLIGSADDAFARQVLDHVKDCAAIVFGIKCAYDAISTRFDDHRRREMSDCDRWGRTSVLRMPGGVHTRRSNYCS